jgi:hypothetical protein
VELGFVSSSSPQLPCLLSPQNFPSKNSELADRLNGKLRIVDRRRKIGCSRRRLGVWLRRKKIRDERRRQNRNGKRRRYGGRG